MRYSHTTRPPGARSCALGSTPGRANSRLTSQVPGASSAWALVAARAMLTVDLRNTDEAVLAESEWRLREQVAELAAAEGVEAAWRSLARFEPVAFDPAVVDLVERAAEARGLRVMRLPRLSRHLPSWSSAHLCPTAKNIPTMPKQS